MASAICIIVILALVIVIEYSMVVASKEAEEEAERVYAESIAKKRSKQRGQNSEKGVLSDEERKG